MTNITHENKLSNWNTKARYKELDSTPKVATKKPKDKPARASRRQLAPVLTLLKRVAVGGDATCAVDAASLIPVLERAVAAASPGQPRHRALYIVTAADGSAVQVQGLAGAATASGKARSTLANALTQGKGKASFPATDEHGNPAAITVSKVVP